jgi:hypothetical protein
MSATIKKPYGREVSDVFLLSKRNILMEFARLCNKLGRKPALERRLSNLVQMKGQAIQ